MNVVKRWMYVIKSVSTPMDLTSVLVDLVTDSLQMKSPAMVCLNNDNPCIYESNLKFQTSMNAVKRLIDVTKTATMLLVHMPVAVTEAIVLGKMESHASVLGTLYTT